MWLGVQYSERRKRLWKACVRLYAQSQSLDYECPIDVIVTHDERDTIQAIDSVEHSSDSTVEVAERPSASLVA
jgi:hypothetical protein